jgi:hypothetical protein
MNCKSCGGDCFHLGNLGHIAWWRCRYCGAEWSVDLIERAALVFGADPDDDTAIEGGRR